MPSPQRPRGAPALRAALHERSDSQTNERASSTLRMVGEPHAPIYGTSPYPTKPSQIFPPKAFNIEQGSPAGAGAELSVSRGPNPPFETKNNIEDPVIATKHNESPGSERDNDAASTQRSSTTASFYTPQTLTPLHTSSSFLGQEQRKEDAGTGRESEDIVHLPSVSKKPSNSEFDRPTNTYDTSPRQAMAPKESDSSLSSYNSTGTVIVKKTRRNSGKRASYSAFPRPSSSRSNLSTSTSQRPAAGEVSPISPVSPVTPTSLAFPPNAERRASSLPIYNVQAASPNPVNLQYPVIRAPAASASWVETPLSKPQRTQRTLERVQDRWNPHLSTVQSLRSEGTGSGSDGRASQTMWLPDSSRVSKSSSAIIGRASSEAPALSSRPETRGSADLPPLPSPPSIHQRNITDSTIRVVNEQDDELLELPPQTSASRDSTHLGVPQGGEAQNSVVTKPGSRSSFFRDSIPAWAKAYYGRPTSSLSIPRSRDSRPSASTDDISLNALRQPKARVRGPHGQWRASNLLHGRTRPAELSMAEMRGQPRPTTSSNFSPHLWHDRTSLGRRRTIFQAPSLDEKAEGSAMSKRNAQILLFALGFVFVPGYLILWPHCMAKFS